MKSIFGKKTDKCCNKMTAKSGISRKKNAKSGVVRMFMTAKSSISRKKCSHCGNRK